MAQFVTRTSAPASRPAHQTLGTTDRPVLRLAATLLVAGVLLSLVAGSFHAGREPANHHTAAFAEYAASGAWTAAHLGQFAGMALLLAGLLVPCIALPVDSGAARWAGRLGALFVGVTFALYGVLQAVDGIALKHAVDAWAHAPAAEQTARFASAEAIRWIEWGLRSYHSVMLGLSLVLVAAVLVWTARLPRLLGVLMALSGIAYLIQGWIIGAEGFSATNTAPTLAGILLTLGWSSWLVVSAWRLPEAGRARSR